MNEYCMHFTNVLWCIVGNYKHRRAIRAEPMTFFFTIWWNLSWQPMGLYTSGKSHPNPSAPTTNKKFLWLSTIKPGNDSAAWLRGVKKKPKKALCFTVLQRTQTKTSKLKLKLTVEKYCIHNLGKDQWKVNNFTSEINASCSWTF